MRKALGTYEGFVCSSVCESKPSTRWPMSTEKPEPPRRKQAHAKTARPLFSESPSQMIARRLWK